MYEKHPVFEEPEKDAKIWRYIDLPKLVSMLDRKSLFFVKVSKLQDPYEGTMPKFNDMVRESVYESAKPFKDEQEKKTVLGMTQSLKTLYKKFREAYAINSWYLDEYESASMWKLYSQINIGIAIQSTFKKLCDCFSVNTDNRIFIGKVKYLDFEREWMNEGNAFDPFMVKRKSFSSERELRALTVLPDDPLFKGDKEKLISEKRVTDSGIHVSADLGILIEQIYVSPLVGQWVTDVVKSVVDKFKPNREVIQSELYSLG